MTSKTARKSFPLSTAVKSVCGSLHWSVHQFISGASCSIGTMKRNTIYLAMVLVVCFLFSQVQHCVPQPSQKYQPYCDTKYYYKKVGRTGCDSRTAGVYVCVGTCQSFVTPYASPPYFRKTCSCCKPASIQWKWVKLENCGSNINPYVWIESAKRNGCECLPCDN